MTNSEKNRRILRLAKMAYPEIDARSVRLIFVSPPTETVTPLLVPPSKYIKTHHTELQKFMYEGKHWDASVRFGYNKDIDVLFVRQDSFQWVAK